MNVNERWELEEYIDLDHSEFSEAIRLTMKLMEKNYLGEKTKKMLEKELESSLTWFRLNYKIVEKEEMVSRKYKKLEGI